MDSDTPEADRTYGQPAAVAQLPQLDGATPAYLSGEEALRLTAWNSATGVTVRMTGRFLPVNSGRVTRFAYDLVPATDRSASSRVCPLGEGWLLDVSVIASAGTPTVGQCFVAVAVTMGQVSGALDLSLLLTGYVTAASRAAWPNNRLFTPVEGAAAVRTITGTVPAAGADIVETVPARTRWQLLSIAASLTTSAVAATRAPSLTIDDGGTIHFQVGPSATQAASLTALYSAGSGINNNWELGPNIHNWPLYAPALLPAGHRIRTVTSAIQAADQWTAPRFTILEWIEV